MRAAWNAGRGIQVSTKVTSVPTRIEGCSIGMLNDVRSMLSGEGRSTATRGRARLDSDLKRRLDQQTRSRLFNLRVVPLTAHYPSQIDPSQTTTTPRYTMADRQTAYSVSLFGSQAGDGVQDATAPSRIQQALIDFIMEFTIDNNFIYRSVAT
jgi:hypothetical protein